ncbi:MAG TPA: energy transducer TonB [Pyrinomonadaceae bacterium]|nr:energy transducer TonB [Pyrinomonadaceae bacterium]
MTIALVATAQTNLTAKASVQPNAVDGSRSDSDRARDGLTGPVRRVRTEVVKLSNATGKSVEDPKRVVLETAEYDVKGVKTQNQYFPVSGATLTGREVYKYDDKGNISEMTLLNADGSLLSKEVYKYEFDTIGNWTKMTTSVAVVENGTIGFEPTEVTYRTIFYYLDASMTKMLQPPASSAPAGSSTGSETRVVASLPARTSAAKLNGSQIQPLNLDLRPLSDSSRKNVVASDSEPPPAPKPLLKPVSGGVLNGKAIALPAPTYPDIARRMRQAGKVEVEVIVDENGKVISARATAGPSVLRDVAVEAALRARFTPTKLSGQPVKISGRIDYNFTLP